MIKRMDSVGNSVIIEERSVGEIINELTLNGETLDDKVAQLVDQVNDLETKLDSADLADKIESLENRMDDIDYKLDETSEQIKEMAQNAEALVNILKQIATS
jgi:chaperonin cofactor prefoldin|tara:strand:+ start:1027 stop:1332 length:306 start_codon:yes stop_codon:yes gene_type:complete